LINASSSASCLAFGLDSWRSGAGTPSETDDSAGEFEQALMEVGASLVAGAEAFELVEPGERALDYPDLAQSGAVGDASSSDHGFDATLPQ
jgi:hypothetical protein